MKARCLSNEIAALYVNRMRPSNGSRYVLRTNLRDAVEELERTHHPDRSVYPPLLRQCGHDKCLDSAKRIHQHISGSEHTHDVFLANLIVQTYARCSGLADALRAFQSIPWKNEHSWNIIVAAYAQAGYLRQAFDLFDQMCHARAGPFHLPVLMMLVRGTDNIDALRLIHDRAQEECCSDCVLATAMVASYARLGHMDEARRAFESFRGRRDARCWTALISGYGHNSRHREALEAFRAMDCAADAVVFTVLVEATATSRDLSQGQWLHRRIDQEGLFHSQILATALLTMYGRCGRIDRARAVFDLVSNRDIVAWNAMIAASTQNGHGAAAIELFTAMDLEPNARTFAAVLDACASVGAVELATSIYSSIGCCKEDPVIGTAMINLLARSGMIDQALQAFGSIAAAKRDPVAWSSMIAAFAHSGRHRDALELFREMIDEEEIVPDAVTFVAVLTACAHGGMIDHGVRQFASMVEEFQIRPLVEHYGCLIDLLARTGRIGDALDVLQRMPCNPSEVAWTAVMNACRIHGEVETGIGAAMEVAAREPENPEAYVAMAGFFEAYAMAI